MNALLDAALDYAARGWPVLPLRAGGKECYLKEWQNRATTDPDQIRTWWKYKHHNVGILPRGAGLAVIDVDPRHSGDATLDRLVAFSRKSAPVTAEVLTPGAPGGGRHLYFAANGELPSGDLAPDFGPGLEVKAASGLVVAPPSFNSETRREYVWHPERGPDALAELPAWLAGWIGKHRKVERAAPAPAADGLAATEDYLKTIPPPQYVEDLTGLAVGFGGGKVRCPFHDDRTPSLHVYPNASGEQSGWFCFGCRRGGDIYQLAGYIAGFLRAPSDKFLRGTDFLRVQAALLDHYTKRLGADAP